MITLSYVLAMYFSTLAFGGGLDLAQVGAAYLVGSAVATVAPTPGGLGALEAAVIAALVSAGMHSTEAVPAVFLFRIATYWLPMIPGWFRVRLSPPGSVGVAGTCKARVQIPHEDGRELPRSLPSFVWAVTGGGCR